MSVDAGDYYAARRAEMVDQIARIAREAGRETGRPELSERVLTAMRAVPRHRFVSVDDERAAYGDRPLSIGNGQTISQPYMVALMTDLMAVEPAHRVLEVGTGSGYQAAVLSHLAQTVYTVEIVEPLGHAAAARFETLGYGNIYAKIGDGYQGWSEHAPFDAIMVTAAAREVPPPLIEQLKPGGRLVIPLGMQFGTQTLYLIEKGADGSVARRAVLAVRFVPLTGGNARQ